ncbi:MAG: hypothetical protein ACXWKH_05905 [Limisphaerales bacterium]
MLKRILKISTVAPVVLLCGCSSILPFAGLSSQLGLAAAIVIALAGLLFAVADKAGLPTLKRLLPDQRFNEEHITHTFIAAIPTLTREMNLEVAVSKQTEVFEKTESRKMFGIDLGTNTARISVPVTYRYHVCLYHNWKLQVAENMLIVCSPAIQSSVPPAIHTDEIQQSCSRGWLRGAPNDLLEQLHREMTPTLTRFANDPKRMDWVRETCRSQVAEFVRRWLEKEGRWGTGKFTAINVQFENEPAVPVRPTLQVLSFQ